MKRDNIRLLIIADLHYTGIAPRPKFDELNGTPDIEGCGLIHTFDTVLAGRAANADHVIIAGDFTHGGRNFQYRPVASVLKAYSGDHISVVPGNHDLCLNPIKNLNRAKYLKRFDGYLGRFMTQDKNGSGQRFPYVKEIGDDIAIIGLDTTTRMANRLRHSVFGVNASIGEVGAAQTKEVNKILASHALANKWNIVVMHHDPFEEQHFFTKLGDREDFKQMLIKASAKRKIIVVCGHLHKGVVNHINENILHIQPPAFCGRRAETSERFVDITINSDLSYKIASD